MICNYEESADSLTEAKEILLAGSQQKENFSCDLNSVLLGKIVSEIWGEKVKLVRRGPRKDRRSWYLNLRPKDPKNFKVPQETFQQIRESSMELVGGWNKVSDHPNTVSFIRYESGSFNNQRVSIEFKVTQLPPSKIRYTLLSHGCESDVTNIMDVASVERYPLSQRAILILAFIDNGQLCRGAPMENGETTTLSHTTGNYVDFTEGAINTNVGNIRAFSGNCSIVRVREGICCANCKKIKLLGARAKRRKMARDTIHPYTNKRYLSKSEVGQQLAEERQARYNAEKREHYWKEKFKSQCLEMDREDDEDLSQIFLNIGKQNVSLIFLKYRVMRLCLDLYCKNPHVLDPLRQFLVLPSNKTIR